ncbi:ATPase regulatory subunit 11 [Seminavis robusta]|uniref:ATPase regulatory subunit 11 n=1 Tax=Seminavis robusta TaxID=568900 RepID=A0A9N8HD80_9STRA|nr:ATPase regulatory subunit 11 [Seminavis robusta]|eukprot:Sro413_g138100.1 ATPase regulatory subunit 11 (473) ;mRNA; r:36678-38193
MVSEEPVAMEVEPTAAPAAGEEEEDVQDLMELADEASALPADKQVPILISLIKDEKADVPRYGSKAVSIKERAVYDLTRAYCAIKEYNEVVNFLTGATGKAFFDNINRAKCAKLVRQVLDIVCSLVPDQLDMQEQICNNIIEWTRSEKRTFLRQRVEAKLASILFLQKDYASAIELIDRLLRELKKLDDKQLLVEAHLMESKIHFALRNVPKAKAALTASRTAANAIYVSPSLQASIDTMSGTIHTQEGDYNTAHSYFLEAFEQLDQMNNRDQAIPCLKYMTLCRILDSLNKALKLSAKGGVGATSDRSDVDISGMITGRQGVKYAGRDIEAMLAVAKAASRRSLKEYEAVLNEYSSELQDDLLIKHHLQLLQEQLLESNLIRIIEPYSCVEIEHISKLIEISVPLVERKLSQMILDGKFQGILDQGKGQLVVYEESEKDSAMEKGLEVIANMDAVVTSLFERSKALRTMML